MKKKSTFCLVSYSVQNNEYFFCLEFGNYILSITHNLLKSRTKIYIFNFVFHGEQFSLSRNEEDEQFSGSAVHQLSTAGPWHHSLIAFHFAPRFFTACPGRARFPGGRNAVVSLRGKSATRPCGVRSKPRRAVNGRVTPRPQLAAR